MKRVSVDERRARLAIRHHLAPSARAHSVLDVAGDLLGLHATGAAAVFLSAWARMQEPEIAAIERALYDERTLLRMLGMRRTVFVVPPELAAVIQAACTRSIARRERLRLEELIRDGGITDDPARWVADAEDATLAVLAADREASAAQLSKKVPQLRERFLFGSGKKWEGYVSVSTRLLFQLAAEGKIVRGRPLGSWISTQYRWSPMNAWAPRGLPELPMEAAQVELVRRWLASFGPGMVDDLKWWTGLTLTEVRRALAAVNTQDVQLDEGPGLLLAGDLAPVAALEPWVALLPALDPTIMGWTRRAWFLGEHAPMLFDRSGNAGPTVWSDGRVIGGWGQRPSGEIVYRLLEEVGEDVSVAIEAEAHRLQAFIGSVRVTPAFRTPLERSLSA